MVRIQVGGHPVDFTVDTGAEHSVVTQEIVPLSGKKLPSSGPQALRAPDQFVVLDNADFGLRGMR